MKVCVPKGFRFAAVHCGIKRNAEREDLTLVVCDRPAVAAGVYTQNLVRAAPVVLDRQRTPSHDVRAVVINSGNANACTGEQGDRDARHMARLAAEAAGASERQALVMSTGIIGEPLPMEKIRAGIEAANSQLADSDDALTAAARGIMTTDLVHKIACREIELHGTKIRIAGIAKGSGMIGIRMATMLGLVMTDATLDPQSAQRLLGEVAEQTFNCVSVDGHTSTNDTLLLLASGAAGRPALDGRELAEFQNAVAEVCEQLAQAIADDGEGATHLITIDVEGCATRADARQIAKSVADSPLVKTAIAGGDPNWGRIVSAAGYAGVPFNPLGVVLKVNGHLLYENGQPIAFDRAAAAESIRTHRGTSIHLQFSEGPAACRFWTSDLTAEYVRINADYHT